MGFGPGQSTGLGMGKPWLAHGLGARLWEPGCLPPKDKMFPALTIVPPPKQEPRSSPSSEKEKTLACKTELRALFLVLAHAFHHSFIQQTSLGAYHRPWAKPGGSPVSEADTVPAATTCFFPGLSFLIREMRWSDKVNGSQHLACVRFSWGAC